MKKTLLIALSLLLSNAAFSQTSDDYNYSLAVKGYSIMQMPKVLNQKKKEEFKDVVFHGGMIKFNDNQISYRLGGSYIRRDMEVVNNCLNCEQLNGKVKDFNFTIGFEKNLNFSRIQPYFGFDIGFRENKFDGTVISKKILTNGPDAALSGVVETSKTGFTAAPVIGIKIYPIRQVALFAESSIQWFYFYERQETIAQDANNTRTVNKYNKSEFLTNAISVGIQVNICRAK
ncbi:hypothetical protein [Pedobacter nyackensis]|uniref:hypothetical protein n=1 Tax=Pedobacter nyackensis TaxID=475255 RepID=UPI00292E870E|nr:hypothetical protein [Pedobacter nyackensis]